MANERAEQLSDKDLLLLIGQGNDLAFGQFYKRHWFDLFTAAYSVLRDEDASKDIVQDTFLGIWENPHLAAIENPPAYLHGIIKNRVLMHLRKGKISAQHLSRMSGLSANTTEEIVLYNELSRTVERTIETLPEKCRHVFKLSRIENLPNGQIAKQLNISTRTVETHISTALKHIRNWVDTSTLIVPLLFVCSLPSI